MSVPAFAAIFVDIAPPDTQALELIGYLNKLLLAKEGDVAKVSENKEDGEKKGEPAAEKLEGAFFLEAKGLLERKAYKELVAKLVDAQPIVFEAASEKEVESCFNLLLSLVSRLDGASRNSLVAKLVAITAQDAVNHPLLRLRLLGNLYNLLDASAGLRYDTFVAVLNYAVASGHAEVVLSQLDQLSKLEAWLQQWGSSVEQKRTLYLIVRKILAQHNKHHAAYQVLLKYLSTYQEGSSESVEYAKTAAVDSIRLVEVLESDHLLRLPAIKYLQQTDPLLYRLLELFSQDTLENFHAFHKEHPDFLASVGLVYEDCLKKMRLLSLATLASQHDEIYYSQISATLSIDEGEVESWIILAISAHILDAKLDQLRRVAIINRVTQRSFTKKEWEQLGQRLHAWRESTASLLAVVAKHKGDEKVKS